MNKQNITDEIRIRLDSPFREFMSAAKRYDEQPSIPNGSRKQDARDTLYRALDEMAEYALENWNLSPNDFTDVVFTLEK